MGTNLQERRLQLTIGFPEKNKLEAVPEIISGKAVNLGFQMGKLIMLSIVLAIHTGKNYKNNSI